MKKTNQEMREELNRAYCAAVEQKGVKNWGEFAKLLGIPEPTMYRIISEDGKISAQMLRRVYVECAVRGIKIEGSDIAFATNNAQNVNAPVTQNAENPQWFELVARKDDQIAQKDEQINRLLSIIENMQK